MNETIKLNYDFILHTLLCQTVQTPHYVAFHQGLCCFTMLSYARLEHIFVKASSLFPQMRNLILSQQRPCVSTSLS